MCAKNFVHCNTKQHYFLFCVYKDNVHPHYECKQFVGQFRVDIASQFYPNIFISIWNCYDLLLNKFPGLLPFVIQFKFQSISLHFQQKSPADAWNISGCANIQFVTLRPSGWLAGLFPFSKKSTYIFYSCFFTGISSFIFSFFALSFFLSLSLKKDICLLSCFQCINL